MSEFVISTRYANALMDISEEKNSFEKTLNDITLIHNTLKDSKELRNFLENPIIKVDNKSNVLKDLFGNLVDSGTFNFLKFLIEKRRENLLFDICKRFITICDEKLNQVNVDITSALELSESQKLEIKSRLESFINKKVIANYVIDSNIIGGFKAKFDDTVIDASVQHQLALLKKKLFEEDYLKN